MNIEKIDDENYTITNNSDESCTTKKGLVVMYIELLKKIEESKQQLKNIEKDIKEVEKYVTEDDLNIAPVIRIKNRLRDHRLCLQGKCTI